MLAEKEALREKCPYSDYSGRYFPAFGLNTERYGVSLRIQFECGKIQTRKTPNTNTFQAVKWSHGNHKNSENEIKLSTSI